jgi:hypothetical protein
MPTTIRGGTAIALKLLGAAWLLTAGGCSWPGAAPPAVVDAHLPAKIAHPKSLVDYNYAGADRLAEQARPLRADLSPVLVASLFDIRNLTKTTPFGVIAAQEIGARLVQHGFIVVEPRTRATFTLSKGDGAQPPSDSGLAEDQQHIRAKSLDAASYLVGTYAETAEGAVVNVKLVRLTDNAVLAANDYAIPLEDDARYYLFGPDASGPSQ